MKITVKGPKLNSETIDVKEGTKVSDILKEYSDRMPYPNIGLWKMLEKCGYIREGLIRQGKMVNTWCDYYIYGILK